MRNRLAKYPAKKKYLQGVGTDILWVCIVLAGFLFFTSLVPLAPNDYWWHLRIGEIIFTERSIPNTNLFSWAIPVDQPFFYAAWLSELLFYLLHRLGGLEMNLCARTLLVGTAFWLVAVEARRRCGSWRIASLVLILACAMSTNNLLLRTQMWAFLPFMIIFSLLSRYQDGELQDAWLLSCPVVMIFWVNVHGSFILGLVLMGAALVSDILQYMFTSPRQVSRKRIAWLTGATALSVICILVNPRFTNIISYVGKLLTDPPSQKLIMEWQSPTPSGIANTVFYASILIITVVLAYSRKKVALSNMLLLLGFLWLAWSGQRYVIWYGMVAAPFLAELLVRLPVHIPAIQITKNRFNFLIAIMLFVPVVMVQPWFVERVPLPETYWSQVISDPQAGPLLSRHTPVGAARYLRQNPGGTLFNELGYGSYLIWANPDQPVFVDPRIELYPYDLWEVYSDISYGVRSVDLLEEYGIDRVVLDIELQPELSRALSSSPIWKLEYRDSISEIWNLILE